MPCRSSRKQCKYITDEKIIPLNLLEVGGLNEFWILFIRAINISPLDGANFPTVTMIGEIGKETNVGMSIDEFWLCVDIALNRYRQEIHIKRQQKEQKERRKTRNAFKI